MSFDYDLFTVGAGSGGVRASRVAAERGLRVGVAEALRLGGTCVNVGCVPKKLLVYGASFASAFSDARGFGWSVGETSFDWGTLKRAKDVEIARLNGIYGRLLERAGCELFRGRGRLIDPHTVEIESQDGACRRVTARHILIATGGRPHRPAIPGAEVAWTSDDVFELNTQPGRLLVVGGGYIALEMACIFHGLGTRVTVAHRGPRLLRGFDAEASDFLLRELRKSGLEILLETEIRGLSKAADGRVGVAFEDAEEVIFDAALFAIGRRPNTEGLGLDALGLERTPKGALVVDRNYRTSVDSIAALGDVTDRVQLTPVAIAEAMAFVDSLGAEGGREVDYDHIPTAIFSSPPVASVGCSEEKARRAGADIQVYVSDFRPMKHTISGRDTRSFMKLVVDARDDRVLGVHLVGEDAPEIIQGFAVALRCGATKRDFDTTIGLHPTAAEELVTMRTPRATS